MNTIVWILIIYLGTVAISFPYIRRSFLNNKEDFKIFTPTYLAIILSFIPVYNMYVALQIMVRFWILKRMARKLRKLFKDHPDSEVRDAISKVTDFIQKDLTNPNNKD